MLLQIYSTISKPDSVVKFNTVTLDTTKHHDIIVKCNSSETRLTTSLKYPNPLIKPSQTLVKPIIPNENCPIIKHHSTLLRYTSSEKYSSQSKLQSESSSTLSSAWDIDVEVDTERGNSQANENWETGHAPLAYFRRWLKDLELRI